MAVKTMLAVSVLPVLAALRAAFPPVASVIASARYSSTINLGAVIVGLLVVVVAGIFTIRSNVAKIWRENYDGEKERADNLERDLKDAQREILRQRELKHEALNEAAALKLTDQTMVLKQLGQLEERVMRQVQVLAETIAATAKTSEGLAKTQRGLVSSVAALAESVDKVSQRVDARGSGTT